MSLRKATIRNGCAWMMSPKVPPSMRVTASCTRCDGILALNAWVTVTRVGSASSSLVMGIGSLVRPVVAVESPLQSLCVQGGGPGRQIPGGREQVATVLDELARRLVRTMTVAAEFDPAGVASAGRAHPHSPTGAEKAEPDRGLQLAPGVVAVVPAPRHRQSRPGLGRDGLERGAGRLFHGGVDGRAFVGDQFVDVAA